MDLKEKDLKEKGTILLKCIRENMTFDGFKTEFKKCKTNEILNYQFEDKCTLLMVASCYGNQKIVTFLVEKEECDVNLKSVPEWTALMCASQAGHANIVKTLIGRGADVNAANSLGSTALHIATDKGNVDVVKELLAGKIDKSIKDNAGWTALDRAKYNENQSIVDLLEEKKVSEETALNEKLVQCIQKCNLEKFKSILNEANKNDKEFLNKPFDDRCTWLMCAAFQGSKDIIEYLLEKNCDVNLKSSADWTALMFAAHAGHADIVEMLLNKGAEIDAVNNKGSTALHLTTDMGCKKVVKTLLEYKAKTDIKDSSGLTPILIAEYRKYHRIIDLLETAETDTKFEVTTNEQREVYVEDDDMDVVKIDQPLDIEEGIISTSITSEMQQLSITYQSSSSDSANYSGEKYKNNPSNQKRNRAGKPKYSMPNSGKPLLYMDTPLNRSLKRVGKPWGTCPNKNWLYANMLQKLIRLQEGEDFPEDITESYKKDKVAKYLINRYMDLMKREKTIREWLGQKGKGWKAESHLSLQTIEKQKGNVILFNELELIAKIGHGEFGNVYMAEWKDGEVVAVKKLKAEPVFQTKCQQFKEKIKVACTLQHSNIVTFLGVCDTGYHIVMEYMDMSLYDALRIKQVDFAEQDKLNIMSDIAKGIQYLHASNIAHCDLKTSNVLLNNVPGQEMTDSQERVIAKITDFRLSVMKKDMGSSASAVVASEVLRDKTLDVDKLMKDDVYSEGLVIWELVQEIPSEKQQLELPLIKKKKRPSIPSGLKLNRQLKEMLEKCWSSKPEDRPTALSVCLMVGNIHQLFDDSEGE